MVDAHIMELTTRVLVLEDAWGRVDHLTQGMLAQGFMDDLEEVWLETVMARERDYRSVLHWVAVSVVTKTPVVALRAVVGPGASLEGAPP